MNGIFKEVVFAQIPVSLREMENEVLTVSETLRSRWSLRPYRARITNGFPAPGLTASAQITPPPCRRSQRGCPPPS